MLACALLMANNLRDVPTDALVGKRTLAVRLGERRRAAPTPVLVVVPVLLGGDRLRVRDAVDADRRCCCWSPSVALAVTVLLGARGRALVPVLTGTGLLELAFGVLLGLGLAL